MKNTVDRVSSGLSSGIIIDQYDYAKKESAFLDFRRKTFPDNARLTYEKLWTAYKKKDKVELMKVLSIPLYDVFKRSLKDDKPLPFILYKNILDVKFAQVRVYSAKDRKLNPNFTWHQFTMKYTFYDPELKKEIDKFNVLERRESDISPNDWRICYLE